MQRVFGSMDALGREEAQEVLEGEIEGFGTCKWCGATISTSFNQHLMVCPNPYPNVEREPKGGDA